MDTLFLGLFLFGLVFTVLSFVLGFAQLELHIPGVDGFELGTGDGHAVHTDASPSPFSVSTILAFVTWFGGIGYLLNTLDTLPAVAVLGLSGLGGLIGASIVFFVLARLLLPGQTAPLREDDYRVEGTLARVSLPMSGERVGEIRFTKGGTARSEGARSADGSLLSRNTEVVVLRYERGIAYVEPLDKLLAERTPGGQSPGELGRGQDA